MSSSPGDPSVLSVATFRLIKALEKRDRPIFDTRLGHQLLALTAGVTTSKMNYGNRGHNTPCNGALSGRYFITSQNHQYEVNTATLPAGWKELFNEGIYCEVKPFSVQFYPESNADPRDTEIPFGVFIPHVEDCAVTGEMDPIPIPDGKIGTKASRASV